MKVEPRATVISFEDADFGNMRIQTIKTSTVFQELIANGTELTTVADVLAAPRDCSPEAITAMHDAMATLPSKNKFDRCRALRSGLLAMLDQFELDQFELDQGSAT